MALSAEERQACSDLYFYATGYRHEEYKWNATAAGLLYQYIEKIQDCSKVFSLVTNLPKLRISKNRGSIIVGAVNYLVAIWKELKKIDNGQYSGVCENVGAGYGGFPGAIDTAIMLGR